MVEFVEVLLLDGGAYEAEKGIDGGVVEELVLRIIGVANIHGGAPDAAANHEEHQSGDDEEDDGFALTVRIAGAGAASPYLPQQAVEEIGESGDNYQGNDGEPHGHIRQNALGVVEIVEDGGVELELPELVEGGVGDEDDGEHDGGEPAVVFGGVIGPVAFDP